jgi:hypothetical protein
MAREVRQRRRGTKRVVNSRAYTHKVVEQGLKDLQGLSKALRTIGKVAWRSVGDEDAVIKREVVSINADVDKLARRLSSFRRTFSELASSYYARQHGDW